jgi:3alpha(or 20beta)-hydroxysteroid dehydrogenase
MSQGNSRGQLHGKVAIITGAARGQGAVEVQLFVDEGCRVVATDIDEAALKAAEQDARVIRLRHDVGDADDWATVVASAVSHFGKIDILLNNAAVFAPQSFQQTDRENFELHYRVNQVGVYLGMKTVSTVMAEAKQGAIVNISSVAGVRGSSGAFAYATSKWAIRGMSKSAARDLAQSGIRVNAVIPGLIETAMMDLNPPARNATIISNIPMGRPGQSMDVASAALYLASDASGYLTGSEITVDGGLSG